MNMKMMMMMMMKTKRNYNQREINHQITEENNSMRTINYMYVRVCLRGILTKPYVNCDTVQLVYFILNDKGYVIKIVIFLLGEPS